MRWNSGTEGAVPYEAVSMKQQAKKTYIAIDLKSFYASVACADRGLDPLTTHLVVADESRTTKTICLAVSPALKAQGIPGRPRLFEVVRKVEELNAVRRAHAPGHKLEGEALDAAELADPTKALGYLVAVPEMARYIEVSTQIYQIYLKYVAPEDIHVYSIDEVFIDATMYLGVKHETAHDFAMRIIRDILAATGITATAGIGPNLYLCKIAMDIWAKKSKPDKDGVRIAERTERSYREHLWSHRPLTDFWRLGPGYARRLAACGLYTMGDIARYSLTHGEELYRMFGVNAELLIDHAWGWEPCTIRDIKSYRPESSSLSSGQVLHEPYDYGKARLVTREMTDLLTLDLVEKRLVTDQIVLTIGYDLSNLSDPARRRLYRGPVDRDYYGRGDVPRPAHGSINLGHYTASTREILEAATALYERIVDKNLLVRRIIVAANHVCPEGQAPEPESVQLDLFSAMEDTEPDEKEDPQRERRRQEAILRIREKYGKNAILRGMNLEEGATARDRNRQIGGHRA